MSAPSAIYNEENITCAFQLLYGVSVFWTTSGPGEFWLPQLTAKCETLHLRILKHYFATSTCSVFLVSTRPDVSASDLVRQLKGQLQAIVRTDRPKAFQRNYDLLSIGSTRRSKAENYVARQLVHHAVDEEQIRACRLDDLQFINPHIDLGRYRFTAHGRFRCNLHVAFRFNDHVLPISPSWLERVRNVAKRTADRHELLLSRLGLLFDHLHLVVGIPAVASPGAVALSFMNNISWIFGMQPVLWHSCYLGTIGEYDLGAVT